MSRPDWDSYFMSLAFAVAKRHTCPRRAVGAVLVRDKRIIGSGYNGAPPGIEHCEQEGCYLSEDGLHCLRAVHAETNCLLHSSEPRGATMYLTDRPCLTCTNSLVTVGIGAIYYAHEYEPHRDEVDRVLAVAGIPLYHGAVDHSTQRA